MRIEDWKAVRLASRTLALLEEKQINAILMAVAEAIPHYMNRILEANETDLSRMNPDNPKYDRLRLTEQRLLDIASDIRNVAALPSPLNQVLEESVRPNGLRLKKVSVPFGVIGIIYEARPNVTFDVFSLCLKSGSACVLKGGSDAAESNRAIVDLLHKVLADLGADTRLVTLLPPGREAAEELLHANGWVDLIIPRGSSGLIDYVRQNATVPVIETGAGVCHTYFDASGNLEKGIRIVNNAKTRRVSVCNALDCLLVHESRINDLAQLCAPLQESKVTIYADEAAYGALCGHYPASLLVQALPEVYGTEFLDYKMAIKTVRNIEEAVSHIYAYGSGHSECIVTEDKQASDLFCRQVDAACVYVNAPTSFTDGAQFGLGAEIGISTQKLHARGPMGLREITTYKWLIEGDGQIRP
ncbi:glutamate-5-semialdehyde dehydrogenase [Phocaeicola sp. KGMB11183]|uniref:Gamma-glutamyl phosphate reductase n=1 Tax=Phocaeicola acetigenes TaxID=3016083 RepID=A0ABT4PGD9_9BACT|nr:glutamate-5-semialdehyde dehydrogenase [Phocaeicola sp. KGMB11183]MCZ8372111.1 glutamate-5-semialdehyde dehydrogenase [Phocaeicola sp. KGMB11183]